MAELVHIWQRILECRGLSSVLIIVGLLVRLALILLVPTEPFSDAAWYFDRAKEIAAGLGYQESGWPTAYWPVGYPGFLAGLFILFSPSVLGGQLANVAAGSISLWLVYSITYRLFERRSIANLALLLASIHFNSIAYSALLLTEPLYTLLLLLVARLAFDLGRTRSAVMAGVLGGTMTLIKAQTWIFFVLWAGLVALSRWRSDLAWSVRTCLTLVVCIFLVVLPWSLRNLHVFGTFVLVSTNGGFALATGNHPNSNGSHSLQKSPFQDEIAKSVHDQVAADRRAKAITLKWIREHPWDFLSLTPKKYYHGLLFDGEGEWGFQAGYAGYESQWVVFRAFRVANQFVYLTLLSCGVLGSFMLWRRRAELHASSLPVFLLIAAWGAGFLVLTFVTNGQSRYHFPIVPFLAILSSVFLLRREFCRNFHLS